ncbi:MAG: hypothetical protein MRY63_08310 [Neomegalonema sp.]|nr:hypothetical protein [Neomegalonema sp.]
MRSRSFAGLLAAGLLLGMGGSALAEEEQVPPQIPPIPHIDEEELSRAARESIERFMEVIGPMISQFGAMINGLPRYAPPEVMPNGDIIIRRLPSPADQQRERVDT